VSMQAQAQQAPIQPSMLKALLSGTRPKTLTAALAPIFVGTALVHAASSEALTPALSFFALISTLFIQIGTNFFNDVLDFKKGADTAERLGPTRLSQSGALSPKVVAMAGVASFLLACLFALPLVWSGGSVILAIGLISLLCGYLYTGGPFPLAYVGLGEVFVVIFFGWVAVGGLFFLHTHEFAPAALLAGTQLGFLASVLIAINNLRDITNDAKAGKKTMAVRLGVKNSRLEIGTLLFAPFALGALWLREGWIWAFVLPLVLLPLAISLFRDLMKTEPGRVYNEFLARSAKIHLGFGVLMSIGLWLR
jgi:1,4-dihydroxy-2-naphthoate octaprenyltransferase